MAGALVLVTGADGAGDEVSLQALTFARRFTGGSVEALVIGPGAGAIASGLGAYGVSVVHVVEDGRLGSYAPDAWARIVADVAEASAASAVVAAGTDVGNEVLARVAARLGEPFAANCTRASGGAAGAEISLTRIRWGGSLFEEAVLRPATRAIMTVVPHAVTAEASNGATAETRPFAPTLDDADLVVRVVDQIGAATGGVSLADAKVVVTGGRGVGSTEGFAPIEELAGLLGGAVGCSRAVTIAGWRPHTDQVGQTGTKIAPEIYIVCGVSGATQHMAGVKGAKKILAINKDAEAPIMVSADYAVIGDLHEVVPAISAEIRRVRGA